MPEPLSDREVQAAGVVGRAMLRGMRATKLPKRDQVKAAIHALITIATTP